MSDTEEQEQAGQGTVLGRISTGETDTTLGETPPVRVSRRRQRETNESANRLPRGAWIRLRAAGGIVFRTSETTVFDDGRLTYRSSPTAVYGQTVLARELTAAQVNGLRALVEGTDIESLAAAGLGRGRDTVTYELTVRADRRTQTAEAAQGAMPETFSQVVHELGELVRVGADELNG